MKKIAIIPARSGSKRIPKKNIKEFFGKPIIVYSIETAIASGLFDSIMVSTDCPEIAQIAVDYGASIPFLRSELNSNDHATTFQVIQEVLDNYKAKDEVFDYACCIYPTAPLLSVRTLKSAYEHLIIEKFDSVFPVLEFGFPIWRALSMNPLNGKVNFIWEENATQRSQDLPKAYHDAGQFYWFSTDKIMEKMRLITDNSGVVLLDESEAQDIDTLSDWQLAEFKYKAIKNIKL